MRIPTSVGYVLTTVAAITLVAGCSGSSSQVAALDASGNLVGRSATHRVDGALQGRLPVTFGSPIALVTPNRSRGWMKHVEVDEPLTYVSDAYRGDVTVFDRKAKIVGKITAFADPIGMFVDAKRNLWVANEGGQNVLEFARGGTSPIKTLNDPGYYPSDVTKCPNGTVYVSNAVATSGSGQGNVEVYAAGSVNPTATLSWPRQGTGDSITCDANNNVFTTLFLALGTLGGAGVVEYPGGKQLGAMLLPINMAYAGGIKMDNAGNLLISDTSSEAVEEFTETGSPTGVSISTSPKLWYDIALTQDGKVLLGAGNTRNAFAVQFPSGTPRRTYRGNFITPYGVAFDPGQKPD